MTLTDAISPAMKTCFLIVLVLLSSALVGRLDLAFAYG